MAKRTVNTAMTGPVPSPSDHSSGAVMDHNTHAPFTKPHSMGGGGLSVKFYESMGESAAPRFDRGTPGHQAGLAGPGATTQERPKERASVPKNNK